jgi:predicted nucleic acid-binding protein
LIVVDASVLTDFLLGRPQTLRAMERELVQREHEPLHAPELVEPETLNALRGLVRGGAIGDRRATEAVADLASVRLLRYPHAPLRERVWGWRDWGWRDNLSAYDATYVALAEALDDSVLLTGDSGLAAAAAGRLGEHRVRHVH